MPDRQGGDDDGGHNDRQGPADGMLNLRVGGSGKVSEQGEPDAPHKAAQRVEQQKRSVVPLVGRARQSAAYGYAVATIDAPGCGDRPRSAADEQARADLRRAMQAGEPVDEIFESFIGPWCRRRRAGPGPAAGGSLRRKTLHANLGGHTGTPWFEVEDGDRFFGRHLK